MQELKADMTVLGKEAAAGLSAVDSQQQRLTFHSLVALACKPVHSVSLCYSWCQRKEATLPIPSMENNSEKMIYYLAEGNPILGVHIYLYLDDVVEVECPQSWSWDKKKALCHATSDADGKFTLKSIPWVAFAEEPAAAMDSS